MKKIVLTGGGTAGHVNPNIALIKTLEENNFQVKYIGGIDGIEKELIENSTTIKFHGIKAGKLRRYISLENVTDMFKTVSGVFSSIGLLRKIKPDIVFSKGGFVTVPVVIAAKLLKIPIVIHESDITPGLANKISIPFATKICVSFPETISHIPKEKAIISGSPIRKELFELEKNSSLQHFNLSQSKPTLLVMGGSLGAKAINDCIREILPKLVKQFQVIHLVGKGNLDQSINLQDYLQFEYLSEEIGQALSAADIIISRAGANSIFEFLALKKPNILIPLSKKASRGDQILNANSFKEQGFSEVIEEENLNPELIMKQTANLFINKDKYIRKMESVNYGNGVDVIVKVIVDVLETKK